MTWLKTFSVKAADAGPRRAAVLAAVIAVPLAGCLPALRNPMGQVQPPAQPSAGPTAATTRPEPLQPTGLISLPSADQFLASVPTGRADPFARVGQPAHQPGTASGGAPQTRGSGSAAAPSGATARSRAALPPPPLTLPPDFRFTGVMRAGSTHQALVQIGDQAGPVCVGPRGFCASSGLEALLPPGWTVASIDVDRGRLTLRQGRQSVTTQL